MRHKISFGYKINRDKARDSKKIIKQTQIAIKRLTDRYKWENYEVIVSLNYNAKDFVNNKITLSIDFDIFLCEKCNSQNIEKSIYNSDSSVYEQFECNNCGHTYTNIVEKRIKNIYCIQYGSK